MDVIWKVILLLAILIGPLFYGPHKKKGNTKKNAGEGTGLSDYGINEEGYLEEIKKRRKLGKSMNKYQDSIIQ